MCIGVTYTLCFILGGIFINNKIHLIAIEVIKLLFIAVLIKIDYTFIFLLGFYPRILITIYMYICSMKLKHYDGINIKTVIHIANKYEELYFVKTNDKRWYVASSDLSLNKISNFYGRDSFINFKTGVVSTGYNIKLIKFEFMLVYIFSVISILFLGLDNYSFIIFNLCHFIYKLYVARGAKLKTFSKNCNDEGYNYIVASDSDQNLYRKYVLYGVGKTKYINLCNTCNIKFAFSLKKSLEII